MSVFFILRGKFSELSYKKHSVQDVQGAKEEGVIGVTARKRCSVISPGRSNHIESVTIFLIL